MTIVQLTAFLAALEHGSFTAAAMELDTTQASVSELIARLERELNAALFIRGGRRLVPTDAAGAVKAIGSGVDAVRANNALESGTCTFGVLRNAAYYNLFDLVQRFHRRYPGVIVRLVGLNSSLVAESIAAGEIEAGLVVLPVDESGLRIRPLFRDEVLYASARRSPQTGSLSVEELSRAKLVL